MGGAVAGDIMNYVMCVVQHFKTIFTTLKKRMMLTHVQKPFDKIQQTEEVSSA